MNSKWNKNINIKAETIKLLEENTGTSLNDLGLGNTFSDMIPKSEATKEKINWTSLNFKTCMYQRTLSRIERTHRMGENICKSYI